MASSVNKGACIFPFAGTPDKWNENLRNLFNGSSHTCFQDNFIPTMDKDSISFAFFKSEINESYGSVPL